MAAYTVLIKPSAEKDLKSLPAADHRRVSARIVALGQEPRPPGCKRLAGSDAYRIRVGDYRVVYTIDDTAVVVLVVKVAHRRDVYRA